MEEDILFKLGFEAHPRANASLETLARAVEEVEKRIERVFDRVGSKVETTADRVRAAAGGRGGSSGGGGGAATAEVQTAQTLADRMKTIEDRISANTSQSQAKRTSLDAAFTEKLQHHSRARQAALAFEADAVRAAAKQIEADVELLERVSAGGGASAVGVSDVEVAGAYARVNQYHTAVTKLEREAAREREALRRAEIAEEKKAQQEAMKVAKAVEAERKRLLKETEQAAKRAQQEANRLAKEEERQKREAIQTLKAVAAERRRMEVESRQLAANAAAPWIEAYEKEMQAADRAMQTVAQGREQLVSGLNEVSGGIGKVTRGAVLLGFAQGATMEEVIKQLALVQAGVDLVAGSAELIRGVARGWNALLDIKRGNIALAKAEAAAARVAAGGSAIITEALNLEALAAGRADAAHRMLGKSRMTAASAAAAEGAASAAGGAARGRIGMIGQAIGGAAMAGAGKAAAGLGLAGVGTASVAALGAAAAAAAAGLGLAAKGAYDFARDVRANGFGGGSQRNSFAESVGGAKYNPFSALIAWNQRAEAAQAEEKTARMQANAELEKLTRDHQERLYAIQAETAMKVRQVQMEYEDQRFADQLSGMGSTQERAAAIEAEAAKRLGERDTARAAADGQMLSDGLVGDDKSIELNRAAQEAEKRYQDILGQRADIIKQLAAEEAKSRLDTIKGIEDTIKARMRERSELEDQYKTAKQRFGEMNAIDQQLALQALEQARTMNPLDINEEQAKRIGQVGTDEGNRILAQRANARADAAGFDQRAGGEFRERQGVLAGEIDKDVQRLAKESGQAEEDLRANAADPAKLNIVNNSQIEVEMAALNQQVLEEIMVKVDESRRQFVEQVRREIQALDGRAVKEQADKFGEGIRNLDGDK